MCTLSIIAIRASVRATGDDSPRPPARSAYRVVMNRDERDDRPDARPPALHRFQSTAAIAPIDALAGGTWIAANEHALTFTLMNRTDERPVAIRSRPDKALSRGLIIPALAHHASLAAAIDAAKSLDWSYYPPCRLTIFAPGNAADAPPTTASFSWSGEALSESVFARDAICFASSGLGDYLVQTRLPLFDQSMQPTPDPSTQSRFHRHQWPDSPPTSVLMSRPAHRTVSITTVDVGEAITMSYATVRRTGSPETHALVVADPVSTSLARRA